MNRQTGERTAAIARGKRIREGRERKGLNQAELANLVQTHARSVGAWERGETNPRNATARLEDVLGISLDMSREAAESDPVHQSVLDSLLTTDRQMDVLATYERHMREQGTENTA